MKKLILSILLSVVALASYGQGFTKNQLYTGINQNIRLKTASQARTAAMMDSIVASMASYTFTEGLTNTSGVVKLGGNITENRKILLPYTGDLSPSFEIETEGFLLGKINFRAGYEDDGLDISAIMKLSSTNSDNSLSSNITFLEGGALGLSTNNSLGTGMTIAFGDGDIKIQDSRSTKYGLRYLAHGYVNDDLSLTDKKYVDDAISAAISSAGTVTSVGLTQPASGITVSGSPITTSGSITLALADDLAAVEGLSATGIVRRTASNTWSAGTAVNLASEVAGILPIANGGTGSSSQNFVGTTGNQSGLSGTKDWAARHSFSDGSSTPIRLLNSTGTGSALVGFMGNSSNNRSFLFPDLSYTTIGIGSYSVTNGLLVRDAANSAFINVVGLSFASSTLSTPNLSISNGLVTPPTALTTTTTLSTQYIVTTSGTFTLNLPAASSNNGRQYMIKNVGTGTITLDGNASETIDGSLTQTLTMQYEYMWIVCNGTSWFILNN